MSFKSLICVAGLTGIVSVAPAQWVAFNDHYAGAGTAPFTTAWNVFGTTGGAPGSSGPLRNIVTGDTLPVTIAINNDRTVGGTTSGAPDPGTPAYNIFNGYVDFGNGTLNHAIQMPDPASPTPVTPASGVATVFTGLNPAKRYKFTGTGVRGNAPYTDRWGRYELVSADSF